MRWPLVLRPPHGTEDKLAEEGRAAGRDQERQGG
jgi:hypothetical protein